MKVHASVLSLVLFCFLIVSAYGADQLSSFRYTNFSSANGLAMVFAKVANGTLVMSEGGGGSVVTSSAVWFTQQMQVRGFRTQFVYTISNNSQSINQRPDGLAFLIHLSPAGTTAIGSPAAGMGYGSAAGNTAGIQNSVAVEFDSWYNQDLQDPTVFHIGVHANGPNPNNASELHRIGGLFQNGNYNLDRQTVIITYDPVINGGTLTVQLNDQTNFTVPNLSIANLTSLDPDTGGNAYIGFTAGSHNGTASIVETITVESWTYDFLGRISAPLTLVIYENDTIVAGEALGISVTAVDQYNNPMIVDGVAMSNYVLTAALTESDGNVLTSPASYSGYGKYVLSFNTTKSGNATLRVYLNTTLVGEGAYVLSVIPAAPYAPLSFPFGFLPGTSTPAVAGVIGTFFVQLRDIFGNNITTDVGPVASAAITPLFDSSYSLQVTGVYSAVFRCYTVSYNVTVAGNFSVRVTVNGQDTSDNVHQLEVSPNEINPGTSVLYGVNSTATAGEMQLAYVQLKDVFGNNASNAEANLVIQAAQDATVVNGSVVSCNMGLCQISFNLTVASYNAALYAINVIVNGLPVLNSHTTTVQVNPAALSTSASYAYGEGITFGVAGELVYFTVQLTDAFGNNGTYGLAALSVTLTAGDYQIRPTAIGGPAGGTYPYEYNVTLATSYTLSILVNSQEISNSQNTVAISPNVVYPPNSIAFGSGIHGDLVVGDTNVFYIQLRDEFHNNITTNGTETVRVAFESSSITYNISTDFVDGLYEVSYNITAASDYNVAITINDIPILNSGENVTILPAPFYPLQCVVLNMDTGVTAGALNQFQVQLRDVYGNDVKTVPQPDGIVTASLVPLLLNSSEIPVTIVYAGDGTYDLSYNITLSGEYSLRILVNGSAISGGGEFSVHVAAAPAYPPLCFTSGALTESTAGVNSSVFIYLHDVFNNSITHPNASDTPVVTIGDPAQAFSLVFDATLPAFVVHYNITTSGKYVVTVTVAGVQITSSPLLVSTAPLFVPNCLATGQSLAGATAGDVGMFYVYLRDVFGNLVTEGNEGIAPVVTMTLVTGGPPPLTHVTALSNGTYAIDYNATIAGQYNLAITINSVNVLNSPFITKIDAAPFNPHGTVTSGLSRSVVAGNLNTFTILLKDIWGNNVTDTNIPNPVTPGDISVQFNNTPIEITVEPAEGFTFAVSYNYTRAGTYWMSVTINETEVGATAPGYVVVSAALLYPAACIAEGRAVSEAIVKQNNEFLVIPRDVYNNNRMLAPNPPVITLTASGLAALPGSAANQTNGTYVVTYFVDQKTTYTMSITFDNIHIQGSPFVVNANYGNNSPPTVLIVCLVLGSVVLIGVIVGAVIWWKRRRTPYMAILE